jgi:hypothetical protein
MLLRTLPVAPGCNKVSENEKTSGNRYNRIHIRCSSIIPLVRSDSWLTTDSLKCGSFLEQFQDLTLLGKTTGAPPGKEQLAGIFHFEGFSGGLNQFHFSAESFLQFFRQTDGFWFELSGKTIGYLELVCHVPTPLSPEMIKSRTGVVTVNEPKFEDGPNDQALHSPKEEGLPRTILRIGKHNDSCVPEGILAGKTAWEDD